MIRLPQRGRIHVTGEALFRCRGVPPKGVLVDAPLSGETR